MTIFALSTAHGRAGVAIIRISGPDALKALQALGCSPSAPRLLSYTRLTHPATGEVIDHGMAVYFQAPHSFTGEDSVELHLHGGRAVIETALDALGGLSFLRPAAAGEFSRQAYLNGKMDLLEVEGLADLIEAQTLSQHRQALRQMDGSISRAYTDWRTRLMETRALLEAYIDFPDEDIPPAIWEEARGWISSLKSELEKSLRDGRAGERIRDGIYVAIVGAPNAGKSSLINALAKRDVAIVSEHAGTTRDVVEVTLDIAGYAVTFADTAGIRETEDAVEREGVRRATRKAEQADIILWLCDATLPIVPLPPLSGENIIWQIMTHSDKLRADELQNMTISQEPLYLSLRHGISSPLLWEGLEKRILSVVENTVPPVITRARHRASIERAVSFLGQALTQEEPELVAEDMRLASNALGDVVGIMTADDILGDIFGRFCIGK